MSVFVLAGVPPACVAFSQVGSNDLPGPQTAPIPSLGDGSAAIDGPAGDATLPCTSLTDPKNCGSCGHDCLGALCKAGKCEPLALNQQSAVRVVALESVGGRLFWLEQNGPVSSGKLRTCNVDGADAQLLVEYSYPRALASDGTYLFVALGGGDQRIDRVDPMTFHTTTLGKPFGGPYDLRVDGTHLYFIDQGKGTQRLSKTNATDTLLFSKVNEPSTVEYKLALGEDLVYPATFGTIYRCAKGEACTSPTAVITQQQDVQEIVESETGALVWINAGSGDVRTCPDAKSGCASAVLLANAALLEGVPQHLALRGNWLFVATKTAAGGGELRRCKMSACPSTMETIVTGDQVVAPMTFDKKAIYWIAAEGPPVVTPSSYRVMKLALPPL